MTPKWYCWIWVGANMQEPGFINALILQLDEFGRVLVNLCNIVPGGIVVFFPSYEFEKNAHALLERTGVIERIAKKKQVSILYSWRRRDTLNKMHISNKENSIGSERGTGMLVLYLRCKHEKLLLVISPFYHSRPMHNPVQKYLPFAGLYMGHHCPLSLWRPIFWIVQLSACKKPSQDKVSKCGHAFSWFGLFPLLILAALEEVQELSNGHSMYAERFKISCKQGCQ